MPKIEIAVSRCKGCGLCVIACPKKLIQLDDKINSSGYKPALFVCTGGECTGCAICAEMCPDVAIEVFK
jgi:2-oxoglutarate ferredoxin oxidoreductase subunit delta